MYKKLYLFFMNKIIKIHTPKTLKGDYYDILIIKQHNLKRYGGYEKSYFMMLFESSN